MDDYVILNYGASGNGKSTGLRNLPLEETVFENVEGKSLPFKGGKRLYKHNKPKGLNQVKTDIKEAVEDDNVKYIVFDSITMFGDNILYPDVVKTAVNEKGLPDTRTGWLEYRDELAGMLEFCKKSGKIFIFLALEKDVYDKREMINKTVPDIQGSMIGKLASHFTYVLYSTTVEDNDKIRYVYQTNKTVEHMDVESKTPMGMFDELYVDNDMMSVLEVIKEWDEL